MSTAKHSPKRFFIAAFGDPGHAFPAVALGKELYEQGYAVAIQTWKRWQPAIEADGLTFFAAPEYPTFPTAEHAHSPYEAAYDATFETIPAVKSFQPDIIVNDILTLAPALAAELTQTTHATLIPHFFPFSPATSPPFASGAFWSKRTLPQQTWRFVNQLTKKGMKQGQVELNNLRTKLRLPPLPSTYGALSRKCCLIATLPQLEYPRQWPENCHVVGPLFWYPKKDHKLFSSTTKRPLVLVAPSTSQDKQQQLLKKTLLALAKEPVTVIAPRQGSLLDETNLPKNVHLLDWIAYDEVMPHCSLTICHGGHGTVAYALTSGCPLLIVPAAGDMYEIAARISAMQLGIRLPETFLGPATIRASVKYLLENPIFRQNAGQCQAWWQMRHTMLTRSRRAILEQLR